MHGTIRRLISAATFVALTLTALAVHTETAIGARGHCAVNKVAYRTETDGATTTSTDWVVVPKTLVKFTQGGSKPGCVVVHISALPRSTYIMRIRAVLDGTIVGTPPETQFEYDSAGYLSVRSFEFVFTKVPPGKHAVRIEWVAHPGFTNWMYERTVTVQHR